MLWVRQRPNSVLNPNGISPKKVQIGADLPSGCHGFTWLFIRSSTRGEDPPPYGEEKGVNPTGGSAELKVPLANPLVAVHCGAN